MMLSELSSESTKQKFDTNSALLYASIALIITVFTSITILIAFRRRLLCFANRGHHWGSSVIAFTNIAQERSS